jgi:hypothetical protein
LPRQHNHQSAESVIFVNGTINPVDGFLIADHVRKRRRAVFVNESHPVRLFRP